MKYFYTQFMKYGWYGISGDLIARSDFYKSMDGKNVDQCKCI